MFAKFLASCQSFALPMFSIASSVSMLRLARYARNCRSRAPWRCHKGRVKHQICLIASPSRLLCEN